MPAPFLSTGLQISTGRVTVVILLSYSSTNVTLREVNRGVSLLVPVVLLHPGRGHATAAATVHSTGRDRRNRVRPRKLDGTPTQLAVRAVDNKPVRESAHRRGREKLQPGARCLRGAPQVAA